MAAKKIKAVFNDQVFIRQTDRTYTHVVIVKREIEDYKNYYSPEEIEQKISQGFFDKYFDFAWCGRHDLAQKQIDRARKHKYSNVKIIEVQQ